MVHKWRMHGAHMVHMRCIHGTQMVHTRTQLSYSWCTHGAQWGHRWCTHGALMVHTWCIYGGHRLLRNHCGDSKGNIQYTHRNNPTICTCTSNSSKWIKFSHESSLLSAHQSLTDRSLHLPHYPPSCPRASRVKVRRPACLLTAVPACCVSSYPS